ncbi:CAP Gly-rich domain-containing protein [Dichotomocladium elegans]|nr:CAP Gly-rich domain-containing protein [Dichotomocladium elegans]
MHLFHFRKKKHPRKARSVGSSTDPSPDVSEDEHASPRLTHKSDRHQTENTHMAVSERLAMHKSSSSPSTPQEIASKTSKVRSQEALDIMLQQEAQELSDAHERRKSEEIQKAKSRPRKLTFELPERPPRPTHHDVHSIGKRNSLPEEILLSSVKKVSRHRGLFRLFSRDSDEENWLSGNVPTYGDHVRILHRPVIMTGRVVYMGSLHLESGEDWYGIELDKPVGSHDGVKHGHRYFQTDRNRGIFVRLKDLELVDDNDDDDDDSKNSSN